MFCGIIGSVPCRAEILAGMPVSSEISEDGALKPPRVLRNTPRGSSGALAELDGGIFV